MFAALSALAGIGALAIFVRALFINIKARNGIRGY